MPESYLIEYCAPTLAGIKTGSLFSFETNSEEESNKEIIKLNRLFRKKGLRAIPLKRNNKRTLLYLYRPNYLAKDLKKLEVKEILSKKGYCCENPDFCIVQLIKKLSSEKAFPHEIGLFLSYPPFDVKCFMNNPLGQAKCFGCWKVFGNKKEAEKIFENYKKCTEFLKNEHRKGKTLAQLVV